MLVINSVEVFYKLAKEIRTEEVIQDLEVKMD